MRWYIIIGTILMAILLTACSVNVNAGNSDAETAIVKNEDLSVEYTDLVEIIKKAKGTEINLSETTEIILVDGTTGRRIVIDDKDTRQLGVLSGETDYGKLQKCYSIWICYDPKIPKKLKNTACRYSFTK